MFALILLHLNVVDLHGLSATCRLLHTVSLDEAALPSLKSAISRNTHRLMQHNLAHHTICFSQCVTPEAAFISPCGQKLAWRDHSAIFVRDRRHSQQASAILPNLDASAKLAWSHDSSRIAMACTTQQEGQCWGHVLIMTVSSSTYDLVPLGPTYKGCWPCTKWAPSACVLAAYPFYRRPDYSSCSFQPSDSDTPEDDTEDDVQDDNVFLCLIDASGQCLTSAVCPSSVEDCPNMEPLWAATSSHLFLQFHYVDVITIIFDLATNELHRFEVPCGSITSFVWSPSSWPAPLLLAVEQQTASLIDAEGSVRTGPTALDLDCLDHAVWGQHGLALVDSADVWLCEVQSRPTGPLLELKHHVHLPRGQLHMPTLSPDHLHLSLAQRSCRNGHDDWAIQHVIVNTLSGDHALLDQFDSTYSIHSCSWSRQGYSLLTSFTSRRGSRRSFFKTINFVF